VKKIISLLMAIIIIISAITTTTALSVSETDNTSSENLDIITTEEKIITTVDVNDNFVEDEIIVVLNNSTSKELNDFSELDFPELPVKYVENLTKETDDMIKAQRTSKNTGTQAYLGVSTADESAVYIDEDEHHQFLLIKLNRSGKANVIKSIKLLEQREDVILAMPNYIDVIEPMEESIATIDEIMTSARATTNTPNDYTSEFGQWGIDRIDLPEAWNITSGSSTVIVGVIDSGIRSDHEDLSANIAASSYHKNCSGDGTSALTDTLGHGTQVAGVIAAKGNNGTGTVGACWNIKLASLKTIAYDSERNEYNTKSTAFIAAITHAKTKGITILNYSSGGSSENADVLSALLNYSGLIIVGAGNDGVAVTDTNHYPVSYNTDNMIAVAKGSDNTNDALASDSNYSTTYVDLSAPGVNILTTDSDSINDYIITEGSSIAAPYVTGVAALLKSKYQGMDAKAIKDYILSNVDVIPALADKVETGGRLNAYKALTGLKYFSIEFNPNGGSGYMESQSIIYGCATAIKNNTYTKAGNHFAGWTAYRPDNNTWYYTNGTTSKWCVEGSQPSGYRKYVYRNGQKVSRTGQKDGRVYLYAQWEPNEINIVFESNNATSGSMPMLTLVCNTPQGLPANTFTRTGCTFDHWYAKNTDGKMYYTDGSNGGWYNMNEIPDNYTRMDLINRKTVQYTTFDDVTHGDTVVLCAYWKPDSGILGDVDGNGSVSTSDVSTIQKHLNAQLTTPLTTNQLLRADVNFDGSVSVKDTSLIQKYIAHIIDEFGE